MRSWPTGASYFALRGGTRQKRKSSVFVNGVLDEIRCRHLVVMDMERYSYTTNMFLCGLVFVCKLQEVKSYLSEIFSLPILPL
jgi:hypothetical protein